MANFYLGADGCAWLGNRDPVYVFDVESALAQGIVVAHDHAVVLSVDAHHVQRSAGGKAETLALADGEIVDGVVAAQEFTGFVDNFAVPTAERNFIFGGVGVNELNVVAVRNETEFHALRLFGDWQCGATGYFADFVLGELAERKFASGELFLGKSPEKI